MAADQQPIRSHALPGKRTAGRLTAIFVQGLIALLPLAVTIALARQDRLRCGARLAGLLLTTSVQPLDMHIEDAMRFLVTAGAKAGKTKAPPDASDSVETMDTTVRG